MSCTRELDQVSTQVLNETFALFVTEGKVSHQIPVLTTEYIDLPGRPSYARIFKSLLLIETFEFKD